MIANVVWRLIGWGLVAVGAVLIVAPVPIPFLGLVPFLLGGAILTRHSKSFRRLLQVLRHRFAFFSRYLERHAHRYPGGVRHMMHRTRPHAILRHARIRRRRKERQHGHSVHPRL
jgi:uncharacterized membrane protein YbaN (DUF454 family)